MPTFYKSALAEINNDWKHILGPEIDQPYFEQLVHFIENEINSKIVFPPLNKIFAAFENLPIHHIKVVILGQDPYHGINQANGLCFSVNEGEKIPPSLKNIFKELHSDLNIPIPNHGNLKAWSQQGVFLLNTTLTVRNAEPGSHQKRGWETFTDEIIKIISSRCQHCVFILWGKFAQQKANLIDSKNHLILQAAHPSPFSAYNGFFGCKHFSKSNEFLKLHQIEPVNWDLS